MFISCTFDGGGLLKPVLPGPPNKLVFNLLNTFFNIKIVSLLNIIITIYMNMQERLQKYKGKFRPRNPSKYIGDSKNIVYRSMWERRCMKYFDVNPSVLGWASEEIAIPYYDTMAKRVRRYFPDFLIKVKDKNGKVKTHLIEVKPTKDLRPPVGGKGKKRSTVLWEAKTYQMNRDKFASARKWCDDRNITFDIWTEKHLKQKG